MTQIESELAIAPGAQHSLSETAFRTLAGAPSGSISFSNFYGKSNGPVLAITAQPVGYDGLKGDWPDIWVSASGNPAYGAITYTWYRNGLLVVNGTNFSGQGTNDLSVNTSGNYYCVVGNSAMSVQSATVNVTLVIEKPTCPAPDVLILMADGTEKYARNLEVGDHVACWDEELKRMSEDVVTLAEPATNIRMRLHLTNGRYGLFAVNHRFLREGTWTELRDLKVGHFGVNLDAEFAAFRSPLLAC